MRMQTTHTCRRAHTCARRGKATSDSGADSDTILCDMLDALLSDLGQRGTALAQLPKHFEEYFGVSLASFGVGNPRERLNANGTKGVLKHGRPQHLKHLLLSMPAIATMKSADDFPVTVYPLPAPLPM